MLRLVHPPPEGGQATRSPRGRISPIYSLTADETRHLRAALKNLRRAYGSWECLAEVIGLTAKALQSVLYSTKYAPHAGLAIRTAKAAGMSVEAILGHTGALTEAGRCKACGSRMAQGRAAT